MITMEDLLGTCQNAFWTNGESGRVENFRYCGQPAMDLPGVKARNMCAACGSASEGNWLAMLARQVDSFDATGAAKWLAGAYLRYVDACRWAYECAARGRSLAEVRRAQRNADGIAEIGNAMLDRWGADIRYALQVSTLDAEELGLWEEDLQPFGLPQIGLALAG